MVGSGLSTSHQPAAGSGELQTEGCAALPASPCGDDHILSDNEQFNTSGMFMAETSCTRAPDKLISRIVQSSVVLPCGSTIRPSFRVRNRWFCLCSSIFRRTRRMGDGLSLCQPHFSVL